MGLVATGYSGNPSVTAFQPHRPYAPCVCFSKDRGTSGVSIARNNTFLCGGHVSAPSTHRARRGDFGAKKSPTDLSAAGLWFCKVLGGLVSASRERATLGAGVVFLHTPPFTPVVYQTTCASKTSALQRCCQPPPRRPRVKRRSRNPHASQPAMNEGTAIRMARAMMIVVMAYALRHPAAPNTRASRGSPVPSCPKFHGRSHIQRGTKTFAWPRLRASAPRSPSPRSAAW